jgi:hypothetical protein
VAVAYARQLGYATVAAVGFSMGASIVLRHAGLIGGVDAVVSVSGPGRWYYRGTQRMRRVHWVIEHRLGRAVSRRLLKTRISPEGWTLVPVPPAEAAALISPVPLLIVHGDQDPYFPPEHARQLYLAAREPRELWLLPGMGHAESACSDDLVDRIARWVDQATAQPVTANEITRPPSAEPEPAANQITRPAPSSPHVPRTDTCPAQLPHGPTGSPHVLRTDHTPHGPLAPPRCYQTPQTYPTRRGHFWQWSWITP